MVLFRYPTFFILLICMACGAPQEVDFILTNATIIDIQNNTTIPNQLIAISGDKIIAVDNDYKLGKYSSQSILNIEGRFVMPGLWDNHVHFRGGDALIEENKQLLPLFLHYGVTTVRDAGGDMTPSVQEWAKQIEAGELEGPNIFTSGPKLDGSRPSWEGSIKVVTDEDVQSALDSLESIQADYVKMYDGNLSKEIYYAIIREAEQRGLQTTGHMPMSADIIEAAELGLDGTEHMFYALKEASPLADSLTEAGLGYGMVDDLVRSYDPVLAEQAYQKLAEKDFFITPTQYIGKVLSELLITDHSSDSTLKYIPSGIQETYQMRLNRAKRGGENYTKSSMAEEKVFMSMVAPMYRSGIYVLAGSDCGPFNSFTYPGHSIHEELRLFVEEAGLTPQEALTTSVVHGPKFFGLEDEYGSIGKGKFADLLILNGNPLEDISNTRAINSVIAKGRLYSESKLRSLLR